MIEVLVAQHDAAGGRIHVIENQGENAWELVYSTAFIDSSSSSTNARYGIGTDLDGDGNWEITFVAGNGYDEGNPNWVQGVYVFEHDGVVGSDNYGTAPATIGNFFGIDERGPASSVYAQRLQAMDIDGDGQQELLIPANGPNSHDVFYIMSIADGEFTTGGVGTTFETWQVELAEAPRERNVGGGSPSEMIAADLDGDGGLEISFHAWNNFNFFNGQVAGADTYTLAPEGNFLQAAPSDDVALFGGIAVDIDDDGNDEIFYPDFQTGNISVLDYSSGDDVLEMNTDHFFFEAIPIGGAGGIAVGDIDGDGFKELIVGSGGYSAEERATDAPSDYIHIAEYNGGDPTDGANYSIESIDTSSPADSVGFHTIHRDSAGVMSTYYELALSKQGITQSSDDPVFPSGIAYLGDADDDGDVEIALSFQGVDDSLDVYDEVWAPEMHTNVFNTPVDSTNPGPIGPGGAYEFTFTAEPGDLLSFATMFVQSNDLFYAPADSGIALYDDTGSRISGDITSHVYLWDAGTEENQEPGNGSNQAHLQAAPNTGPDDPTDTVRLVDDAFTYPDTTDVIQVTITPDAGSTDGFTVRIENVSTETTLNGSSSVLLAPGVWVVHTNDGPIFSEGFADADTGLEALAEDGDPSALYETLAAEFGYIRTLRERIEAPLRPFLRIVSIHGGTLVKVDENDVVLPSDYVLEQNYPNPFNPETTIRFTLPLDKTVSVRVFDVSGRLVKTLVDDQFYNRGTYEVVWDGTSQAGTAVASGTYLYTLEYGNFRQSKTMILLK